MGLSDNGLGRSVADVLARTARRPAEAHRGVLEVDIGLVVPSAANPRTTFDPTALAALAASLQQHGMLQPIVVLRREVGYEILSGERRYRAAQQLGWTKVPVVVRDEANPQHQAELRLVENIQREDLQPIELAQAFRTLLDTHGLTHEALAARVNKDRSTITNVLRLLELSPAVQQLVARGQLSTGHAKALLRVTDPAAQTALAARVIAEDWSVRATERAAALPVAASPTAVAAPATDPHLQELQENLFRLLGVRVQIRARGGKGSLTLRFRDPQEFQRAVDLLRATLARPTLLPAPQP